MSTTAGSLTLVDSDARSAAGSPYYFLIDAARNDTLVFQWVLRSAAAAAPAAAFTFFSTTSTNKKVLRALLNETNTEGWVDETPHGAVFLTVPGVIPGATDRLSLAVNGVPFILMKLDVLQDLTDFSLRYHGKGIG